VKRTRPLVGMTLIELAIVLAIIAIAAAMVIPSFIKSRELARMSAAKNDLRVIAQAVDQMALETARWPGGMLAGATTNGAPVLDLRSGEAGVIATDGRFPAWHGPYLGRLPTDPWGGNYFFHPAYSVQGTTLAVIATCGPNASSIDTQDADNLWLPVN
jgi:type II secretion system protein G